MSEIDTAILYMPMDDAQLYFNGRKASRIRSSLRRRPDASGRRCGRADRGGGHARFIISDWRQRNATFCSALQVERNVMFMI